MIGVILLFFIFMLSLCWLWSGGIDYMNTYHKDYRGEDFLSWKVRKEKN
jgi:hypothetical protein